MTRRSVFLIIAAAILPLILLLVLQAGYAAREQRQRVETEALTEAKVIIAAADAEVARAIGALDVLASADVIRAGDMAGAYRRAKGTAQNEPNWAGVTLTRVADGAVVFDTRAPFGSRREPQPNTALSLPLAPVVRSGRGCPCIALSHEAEGAGGPYRLTVLHSIRPFTRLLPAPDGRFEVSALVNGDGRFIARSLKHAERVGRLGSEYLRSAVDGGAPSGLYPGVTLEGFSNYTAFARSRLTGWSAHLAMANKTIDEPRLRALGSLGIAGLLSLAFAAILIVFVLRQIAESRRAAERMQQTQKLEALGQLTGGIAHDFNNLLTPIVGALDLLSKRQDIDERARRIATNGLTSANRAAKLTGQLLAFSRQQKLTLREVDLCALLVDIRELLEQSAGGADRLELNFAHDNCWAETDPLQLELALINLIINARDASPAGSPIAVSLAPTKLRGADAWQLVVADQGSGMPDDVKARAFEPFFTTKATGHGTGLGLAQVFAFARQSRGEVQIDSAPGAGTRVSLILPLCAPPTSEVAEAVAAPASPGEGFDILVVDDQPEVRETIGLTLEDDGHRVEVADSGAAALVLMAKRDFALAVVDFAMPGMNGAELIAAARPLYPAMRFLIVTGYLESAAVETAAPGTMVLGKPFDPDQLRRAVREAVA